MSRSTWWALRKKGTKAELFCLDDDGCPGGSGPLLYSTKKVLLEDFDGEEELLDYEPVRVKVEVVK